MFSGKDLDRYQDLPKLEILRMIDELQRHAEHRQLSVEELDDLYTLQSQLKVTMEVDRMGGVRR